MANADKGREILDAGIERKPRLRSAREFSEAVHELHRKGMPAGDRTGWANVDELYTVAPGQMTIVTGWPSSGKSEWLDAMLMNLSRQGWRFAMFSFENQPVEIHVSKMLEKATGKPFRVGPHTRLTSDEVTEAIDEISQRFMFTDVTSGSISVQECLEAATPFLKQHEKRGIVIDPWNELEHWIPQGMTETQYISSTLSMVRSWARMNKIHVWIVAHPAKVIRGQDGKLPVAKPDMIAGSQHWWNKADCCISIFRDFTQPDIRQIEVHVQKVRFKHVGKIGMTTLLYNIVNGRYSIPLTQVQKDADRYSQAD